MISLALYPYMAIPINKRSSFFVVYRANVATLYIAEERMFKMILYTKTVCPKCMLVKSELNVAGLEGQYEVVNIDHDEQAKEKIVNAGFMSVPILEVDGELIHDLATITAMISEMTPQ